MPPTASTTAPAMVMPVSGLSGTADSRIAATGGIREARRAGSSAAMTVIPTPTPNAAMTADNGTPSEASSSWPPLSAPPTT